MGSKFGFDEKTLIPKNMKHDDKMNVYDEITKLYAMDRSHDEAIDFRNKFLRLLKVEQEMGADYIQGKYDSVLEKYDAVHSGFIELMHVASYESVSAVLPEIYNVRQMYAISKVMAAKSIASEKGV